jgi:hypothetical protein
MIASSPRRPQPRNKSPFAFRPRFSVGWIAACLLLVLSRPCSAQDALPAWNSAASQAWWTAHPTPDTWPKAADALQAQLEADYKQNAAAVFSDPNFQGWMEHLEWVRLGLACPQDIAQPADLQAFIALGQDDAVSHLLVQKIVPRNVKEKVLQNILRLDQANPADLHEYAALGVAYSLVWDEPFPSYWPHAQVHRDAVPIGDLDILPRFHFYVQANRDKKTELDLTQLKEDDLKYLVDSQVSLAELAYAQKNTIPYDHFEDVFPSIRYDTARVSGDNQVYTWDLPTYTLDDILTHGGICVDQAYYSTEIGKGRGIPTIYFTGQGSSGGHAWFGYLTRDGTWKLDCGRYLNQNYPKGYALDPQTWQIVNDATLENLAKTGGSNPAYQPAENALAWSRLHLGDPTYPIILGDAMTLMPELPRTWQLEGDYLDETHASIADKKAFYQKWITQFSSYADMKVEGQKRLLAALKAANDPDAESLQQDIVLQNRSSGFDLGVQGSLGAIEDKFKAQDWDGAQVAFETSVRDFKDQGGGTFFQNVVRPYVMMCLQYDRPQQADDGLHFTEERMPMDSESILAQEFSQLKDQVKIASSALTDVDKWLGELDDGDYAQAWNDASKTLQGSRTSDQFVDDMNKVRKPLGKCASRAMSSAPQMGTGMTRGDGQKLEGDFIQASYTGTFDNNQTAHERVIFMKDDDGTWRALSYGIKDQ